MVGWILSRQSNKLWCKHFADRRAMLLVLSFGTGALAQSKQVWPRPSTFVRLTDQMRFYFLMTTVKETASPQKGKWAQFRFYLKPLRR